MVIKIFGYVISIKKARKAFDEIKVTPEEIQRAEAERRYEAELLKNTPHISASWDNDDWGNAISSRST